MAETNLTTETRQAPEILETDGRFRSLAIRLLPLGILVAAALAAYGLLATAPTAARKTPVRSAKLVSVTTAYVTTGAPTVEAMGTVLPSREIALTPRVSGQIIEVDAHFQPGGAFEKGQRLVRIDPADFVLSEEQRLAALATAEAAYAMEIGQQEIAASEFELLGETFPEEDGNLILRRPQLRSAQATVSSARAAVAEARLNLERTSIRAPFNGVLHERQANLGDQVGPTRAIGTFVGSDTFWIEASVPMDQLKWIRIPNGPEEEGAVARVYSEFAWGPDAWKEGRIIGLQASLEDQGRMARVLIAVDDPLGRKAENADAPKMILNTYVRVEIEGKPVPSVASISRAYLRDDDNIYLMRPDGTLEIRPVNVVFRGPDNVLVRGIEQGERVVTTDFASAVEGMLLRTDKDITRSEASSREGAS